MKLINDKFLSLLGLCQKARKMVSGSMQCESTIRSGKAYLVIISEEASEATKDEFTHLCTSRDVPFIIFGGKDQLGGAIGKYSRTLLAVTDSAFKEMLLNEYREIQHGGDR
ncbi:MAG: 50S ribosomal protein L7ae [Clostridium sp.]|nr:50S ribosomal protein L7ae [Clostridium sp.]